jgi:foldase protein PrsA
VADEATATTVESRLAKGEKFADLAKELSTDTGSKDNGGDLSDPATHSCPTISVINTTYVPEFAKGVVAAKVGVPSAPVKSQYGYHIILVTSEKTAFNDVKTSIEVAATQGNHANYWLTKAFENAKVTVNTRYGTWDAKTGVKKPTPAGTATTVAGKPAAGSTSPTSAP